MKVRRSLECFLFEHMLEESTDLAVDLIQSTDLEEVILLQLRLVLLLKSFEVTIELVVPWEEDSRLKDQSRGGDEEVDDGEVLEVRRGRDHRRDGVSQVQFVGQSRQSSLGLYSLRLKKDDVGSPS